MSYTTDYAARDVAREAYLHYLRRAEEATRHRPTPECAPQTTESRAMMRKRLLSEI